jgi:uncharacterized protein
MLVLGAGVASYGGIGSAFLWGYKKGRLNFSVEELVVRVPGMSPKLDGYTIVQVSDIHVGPFVLEHELRLGLGLVSAQRPDLVVLTGDLVDADSSYAELLAQELARVQARDGIAGILGNHDHFSGAGEVLHWLRRGGVRMLVNEAVAVGGAGGFSLIGVDDLAAHRFGGAGPNYDAAARMLRPDLPRILLSHQPAFAERWLAVDLESDRGGDPLRPVLQLSGHTHGGQINAPPFEPVRWIHKYVKGRYEVAGTSLYVNRGFGVAGPPVRLGAPPEITKIVLVSG